jgi:hypothetical protein
LLAVVSLPVDPEVPVVVVAPELLLAVMVEQSERTCACCSEVSDDQF